MIRNAFKDIKPENVKRIHCSNITHASMLFATDRFAHSTPNTVS